MSQRSFQRSFTSTRENENVIENKKDLKQEVADIRGLTLLFENSEFERKWNQTHLKRLVDMTTRYLFACCVFQFIFFWSDLIEFSQSESLWHLGMIRFILGIMPLVCCFLVAAGFVVPSQMSVWTINILYGLPSLALFYLSREKSSHWDSLFVIYGLCYFMLPKISPLNFIYAFTGSAMFLLGYIYISMFKLSLQQWVLSNTLLLFPWILMSYISYSSERISRERWLLRERLQREKINLRIVATSIQDDFKRAAANENEPAGRSRSSLSTFPTSTHREMKSQSASSFSSMVERQRTALSLLNTLGGGVQAPLEGDRPKSNAHGTGRHGDITPAGDDTEYSKETANVAGDSLSLGKIKKQNLALFFKGLAAWALCYVFGYTFDMVSLPRIGGVQQSEVNSSAAFALLMHSMGFSVFLLYFTGQIRWLALNGLVGLALLYVFNHSGMETRWIVFSTHSVGYVLLAIVIVVMVLVFGGVVLVWSNLIEFLKDILARYPDVKDELSENKLLEQVLIRYISELPETSTKLLGVPSSARPETKRTQILEVYKEGQDEESDSVRMLTSPPSHSLLPTIGAGTALGNQPTRGRRSGSKSETKLESTDVGSLTGLKILPTRRSSMCFFCLSRPQKILVPACSCWDPLYLSTAIGEAAGISMCTPYTAMAIARDEAVARANALEKECSELRSSLTKSESERSNSHRAAVLLQSRIRELETKLSKCTA